MLGLWYNNNYTVLLKKSWTIRKSQANRALIEEVDGEVSLVVHACMAICTGEFIRAPYLHRY